MKSFNSLKTTTETTDIQALQDQFPPVLTPFATFLDETNWSDTELTYDDFNFFCARQSSTGLRSSNLVVRNTYSLDQH
jgi:hypothetical protein